jgi:hypothetical protein
MFQIICVRYRRNRLECISHVTYIKLDLRTAVSASQAVLVRTSGWTLLSESCAALLILFSKTLVSLHLPAHSVCSRLRTVVVACMPRMTVHVMKEVEE